MGIGSGFMAAGAGFFQGLNTDYQRNYDEQKQFNDKYEDRVSKGIDAFNASRLEASQNLEMAHGAANYIPGDAPYEQKVNAALSVINNPAADKKELGPEYWQRMKIPAQNTQGTVKDTSQPSSGSPMPGMIADPRNTGTPSPTQGLQPTQPSQATQPQMPMQPSAPTQATQPMAPANPQTPTQPGMTQVQPPQQQLAPSGPPVPPSPAVAQPGAMGQANHYITGAPLPGQREATAAGRAADMHGITPDQAQAYAGFGKTQVPNPVQQGNYTQAPDLATQQKLLTGLTPGSDTAAAAAALANGDPSVALSQIESQTDRLVTQAETRGAGQAAVAEINANGRTATQFIRSIPAIIEGFNAPPEVKQHMYNVLLQQGYGMMGSPQLSGPPTPGGPTAGAPPPIKPNITAPPRAGLVPSKTNPNIFVDPKTGTVYDKNGTAIGTAK